MREDRGAGPKVVKVLKFSKSGNHRPQVKKIKVLGNQRIAAGGELKRARKRVTSPKKSAASLIGTRLQRPARRQASTSTSSALRAKNPSMRRASAPNEQAPCPARAASSIGCSAK